MAVTLRDIAKKLNLSHATVSFVLNNRRDVAIPETTRQRVLQASKEMGYRPNRSARSLVMGRTNILGVWLPSIRHPFYAEVLEIVRMECNALGIDILYYAADFNDKKTLPFDSAVDGLIGVDIGVILRGNDEMASIPLVSIGTDTDSRYDCVVSNMESGFDLAASHLLALGRKSVLVVVPPEDVRARMNGLIEQMSMANAAVTVIEIPADQLHQVATEVAAYCKQNGCPDVVVSYDHLVAHTIAQTLAILGFMPPEDYALCGTHVADVASALPVSVTSVCSPLAEMAKLAIGLVKQRIAQPEAERQMHNLDAFLKIGTSTTPKPPLSISA